MSSLATEDTLSQVVQPTPTHHPTAANQRAKATQNHSPKAQKPEQFWAIEPLDPKGKLCEKYCDEWNQELSFFGRRLGHNYQTTDKALEYYRLEMKNNCDNKC